MPPDSPDVWWTVAAFRGYAGHMRSRDFLAAIDQVLDEARTTTTAVMCSESVWWRCHRRLIADFAVLSRGVEVDHLHHSGKRTPHAVAAGARRTDDGLLVYDGGA